MKNKRKKPEKIDVELKECILIAFKKGCMRKAFKTRDYMEMPLSDGLSLVVKKRAIDRYLEIEKHAKVEKRKSDFEKYLEEHLLCLPQNASKGRKETELKSKLLEASKKLIEELEKLNLDLR